MIHANNWTMKQMSGISNYKNKNKKLIYSLLQTTGGKILNVECFELVNFFLMEPYLFVFIILNCDKESVVKVFTFHSISGVLYTHGLQFFMKKTHFFFNKYFVFWHIYLYITFKRNIFNFDVFMWLSLNLGWKLIFFIFSDTKPICIVGINCFYRCT